MRLQRFLYARNGEPRLLGPALVALALTVVLGLVVAAAFRTQEAPMSRALALSTTGHFARAEAKYLEILRTRPSVEAVLAFVDNHNAARMRRTLAKLDPEGMGAGAGAIGADATLTEAEVERVLETELPAPLSLLGRYWYASARAKAPDALVKQLREAADGNAPPEGYNHVLALSAMREGNAEEAATRLEREGISHASRRADLDRAMDLFLDLGRWDYVRERLNDPTVQRAVDAHTHYRVAVYDRNWKRAAKYHLLMLKPRWQLGPLLMSLVTALAWGVFCARLGHLGQRPKFRVPLYLAAFVLGVLSIAPTLTLISVEEAALQLKESGDPLRDLLFFVFGVGFREEFSKLLLFLPLVPILRRHGDRLDVAVCGALVGLGFAAEENVGYLTTGALSTGLSRFLTANFFHMALTGTLALATVDFFSDTEKHAHTLSKTALMVIGMHGLYDFLLTHGEFGGSYLAMTIFVILTRVFLTAVQDVRRGAGRGLSLTHTFVLSTAVVTGATYVYAASAVGYGLGLAVLAQGLLGIAIMLFVFLRTLRGL